MSSFDSMKSKLAPLGVYSLEEGDTVCRELGAYAEGLAAIAVTQEDAAVGEPR